MQAFPLFRLPTELRLSIYEYALVQEKPIKIVSHSELDGKVNTHTSLSRTCRQLYIECSQMLYTANTFSIKATERSDYRDAAENRLGKIGPKNSRALRSLVVDISGRPGRFGDDEFRDATKSIMTEPAMLEKVRMVARSIGDCHVIVSLPYLSKIIGFKNDDRGARDYTVELDIHDLQTSGMVAGMELKRLMEEREDRDDHYLKLWWMHYYIGQILGP